MNARWREFIGFFTSLKLTVALLALSIVLVFVATLAQVRYGIWAVQEIYFRSFFVLWTIPGTTVPIPVFPGGYFIGGLLLINLIAAHTYRFKLSLKKSGIFLIHVGLILLLVGELIAGIFQEDNQMRLDEGETKNYSESILGRELAIIDITASDHDKIVSIPAERLARGGVIQHARLPFQLEVIGYLHNADLALRTNAPDLPPHPADSGVGPRVAIQPLPITYKMDEQNMPAAFVRLIGPNGPMGVWLVSTMLREPQRVSVGDREFLLSFRPTRQYHPFNVTLLKFTHDRYPGTEIPMNFSSRIILDDPGAGGDREVLIYMNNPLRHAGWTFYQAGFANDDRTSILQVVHNPGRHLPYVACALMALGLCVQFGMHLFGFVRKRRTHPAS